METGTVIYLSYPLACVCLSPDWHKRNVQDISYQKSLRAVEFDKKRRNDELKHNSGNAALWSAIWPWQLATSLPLSLSLSLFKASSLSFSPPFSSSPAGNPRSHALWRLPARGALVRPSFSPKFKTRVRDVRPPKAPKVSEASTRKDSSQLWGLGYSGARDRRLGKRCIVRVLP